MKKLKFTTKRNYSTNYFLNRHKLNNVLTNVEIQKESQKIEASENENYVLKRWLDIAEYNEMNNTFYLISINISVKLTLMLIEVM